MWLIFIIAFIIIGIWIGYFIFSCIDKPSDESIEKAKQLRKKIKSWEENIKL